MPGRQVSRNDAIEVYAFAMAYLCDAKYDRVAIEQTKYVKEMKAGVFHFWEHDRSQLGRKRTKPIAICVYNQKEKTWTIKLEGSKKLVLVDKGRVWELVNESKNRRMQTAHEHEADGP